MDVLARVCLGDISLRRGGCKIDKRDGVYLLLLPSQGYSRPDGSVVSNPSIRPARPVRAGSAVVGTRNRRAC